MHHSALFFSLPLLLPFQNPGCEDFEILRVFSGGGDFEILRFFPLCVGTSMGFYDFFPVDGDFEILRFFFAVCGAPVSGDFEILRFFTCVCGPCVWVFEILRFCLAVCVGPLCVWGL